MSVEGRRFYRFEYLESEHWQNLRIAKLASVDAKCVRCQTRDLSNDVHHLRYRNLFDVELHDLAVFCRRCHDLAHEALEQFREAIKDGNPKLILKRTLMAIRVVERRPNHEHNAKFKALRLAGLAHSGRN